MGRPQYTPGPWQAIPAGSAHIPGPWEPIKSGHWTGTWWVRRETPWTTAGFELMRSPAGRPTAFRTEASALAAIAKATGAQTSAGEQSPAGAQG